jgi:hypothetical protein
VILSDVAYDRSYAVTDSRLTSIFHNARLERTYIHRADGFHLLAAETPDRLTMPLARWLPCRYLAFFTWPVPAQRVEHRGDGITCYDTSHAVDQPFIATLLIEVTPRVLPLYWRLGWPLQIRGELRRHWGEEPT